MRIKRQVQLITIISFNLLIFLTACSGATPKGGKPSADWSRGLPLGEHIIGSIGMAVNIENDLTHIIWLAETGNEQHLHYVQLDENATINKSRDLQLPGQLKSPRLLPALGGSLHLLFASRQPSDQHWTLRHALLDQNGSIAGDITRISGDGINIGDFVVASEESGGVILAWDQGDQKEIYVLHLNAEGEIVSGPVEVTSQGETPSLHVDETNHVHLSWIEDASIYYTTLALDDLDSVRPVRITNIKGIRGGSGTLGDVLQGPVLGYADGWVYVFWSILSKADTEAGSAKLEYVTFPSSSAGVVTPTRLWMLTIEKQPQIAYKGGLPLTQISPSIDIYQAAEEYSIDVEHLSEMFGDWVDISGAVSEFMMSPATMAGSGDELVLAVTMNQLSRGDSFTQVATAFFSEGKYLGYNIASKTQTHSDHPYLVIDDRGYLHIVWREGALGDSVYYATTNPGPREVLDRLETSDFIYGGLQGIMDVLASIAFVPFVGFGWILPGFLIIGVWKLFKHQEDITEPTSWVLLGVAILLYYAIKIISLPTITTYVPFSAWLPIQTMWEPIFLIGTPTVIFAISLFMAIWTSKRYSRSTMVFYLSFVITDAILTLAIYGVNFLGAI